MQERTEGNPTNPVDLARSQFTRALIAPDYNGGSLVSGVVNLQNALLPSNLGGEKTYHELSLAAGQAVEVARLKEDEPTVATLQGLQRGFELTYQNFAPRPQTPATPRRTDTAVLPPMTSAKGERPIEPASKPTGLLSKTEQQTLDAIKELEDATVENLAKKLGTNEAGVAAKISQLRGKGIKINSEKMEGSRKVRYKIEEASEETLE